MTDAAPGAGATRLLIVDDDAGIRTLLAGFLEGHGYAVDAVGSAEEMRALADTGRYDLIVLDLMMPGEDGLEALRKLQAKRGPPVIMLSAFGTDIDRIVGLEVGAEDFVQKPCNPRELLARVRAVLRRGSRAAEASINPTGLPRRDWFRFDGWSLDATARVLFDPGGAVVHLSDGEYRMLLAFVEQPNLVLRRDHLLDLAFGDDRELFDRAVDVQISRLRRKLAGRSGSLELIRTVRNEGYLFVPAVAR